MNSPIQTRFLLICHDRSGSNLLRGMLNQNEDVYVIPPLPIFEIIYYYQSIYGNLEQQSNWHTLLGDIAELYQANHYPLPVDLSFEDILAAADARPRTLGGAVMGVFDLIGEAVRPRALGLKFGAHHEMIPDFLAETRFDKAVFQYRDPRDVALSVWKAGVDSRSLSEFGQHWGEWHTSVRAATDAAHMPRLEHRYEDLLGDPQDVLEGVWEFLGVGSSDRALEFHRDEELQKAAKTSYMWENVARPLDPSNKQKFYRELGPRNVSKVEQAVSRKTMGEFGYRPARLWKYSPKSVIKDPPRRERKEEDRAFQARQNAIAERIKQTYVDQRKRPSSGAQA